MLSKRLILAASLLACFLNVFRSQVVNAQTDLQLYEKYIEKKDKPQSFVDRYQLSNTVIDSGYVSLQESAYQTLLELIKDKKQTSVKSVFFVAADTTDIKGIFGILKQFPNITSLLFHYSDNIKREYEFPEDFVELKQLKFLSIHGAKYLRSQDLFSKLKRIATLRGVDLTNYENDISQDATLPIQLAAVQLSIPQLAKLNTKDAAWHFARIQQRGEADFKNEIVLKKLADMGSLEILDCQSCYVKDSTVFEGFKNLRKLTISPSVSKGVNFIKSLSGLAQLKELAIYSLSDTSQSFSDLNKLTKLESLDLRQLTRFLNHPEELEKISALTNLHSLSIQSCNLIFCPDFFKTLKALQTFTFKWNAINHSEKSPFFFPESLYKLPELKELTIWRTLSEIPSLKDLSKLQVLDLVDNDLRALPEGLADLKDLKSLTLASNPSIGNIEYNWEALQRLETLDLSKNGIRRYPESLQRLYNLQYLNLSQNKFSKISPLHKENYKLKVLLLDGNLLDNLPENISQYGHLEVLSANYCGLYNLPADLGLLKNLRILNLERSHLKLLPTGMGDNLNLAIINLKGNSSLDEQSLNEVVFMRSKRNFLWANLEDAGIKSLPANAPWERLKLALDLGYNKLKILPIEMTKMKWFNITLNNNPFPIDTGFIERGIHNPADARIFFTELGYKKDYLNVTNKEMATSMSKASNTLAFYKNFENAVKYAKKAEKIDLIAYQKNIDRRSLGTAFYQTKSYKQAIEILEEDRKLNYKFLWNARMSEASEEALANSYGFIGEKRKAAETHAYFATKRDGNLESSLHAAIGFLEIKELELSKKYFDDALALSKADFVRYENLKDIYIYNYAEILLMAEKPETMLKVFADEDPKVTGRNPAYRDYLIAAASLMLNASNYKSIKENYIIRIARNGKVIDWNYDNFNRWINASDRSAKEKRQLHELEVLSR